MKGEEEELEYLTIDLNYTVNAAAYCRYHKGYLTPKLMKTHKCIQRKCWALQKKDHPLWRNREKKREDKKKKKETVDGEGD